MAPSPARQGEGRLPLARAAATELALTPSASRAKRASTEPPSDPPSKRTALEPRAEVAALRHELWEARRRAEEERRGAGAATDEVRLKLQAEQQKCAELARQRDFLLESEESLLAQVSELAALWDAEKSAREADAREARARLEGVRDELMGELSRLRAAERTRVVELGAELEEERSRRVKAEEAPRRTPLAAGGGEKGGERGGERGGEEGAKRGAGEAEAEELRERIDQLHAALHEERRESSVLRKRAEELGRRMHAHGAISAEVDDLRHQLAAADRQRQELQHLRREHEALDQKLQRWLKMFAAEVKLDDDEAAATAVHAMLVQLRQQCEQLLASEGSLQVQLRGLQGELESSAAARLRLEAEAGEAKADAEQLQAKLSRAEWRHGELQAAVEGQQRLLELLEEHASLGGKGGGAGEVAEARLKLAEAELSAAKERLEKLEAAAAAADGALREARGAAAAAAAAAAAEKAARARGEEAHRLALLEAARVSQGPMDGSHLAEEREGKAAGKVLHLADNPMAAAQSVAVSALRAKVRSLELQLEAAEASQHGGGEIAKAAAHLELQAEHAELTRKLQSAELQRDRLQRVFKEKIEEFRLAVMQLTGYRVDLPESKNYHLYSTYAHRSNVLRFQKNSLGEMKLMESDFTAQLTQHIHTYLEQRDSIPAFLSAITLQLFDEASPPPNDENSVPY